MNKKDRECTWVVSWLLHRKQRLVSKHKIVACMSQSENQSSMTINQSMRKSHMWGPAKTRFSFAQINSMNSIIWNYDIYSRLF